MEMGHETGGDYEGEGVAGLDIPAVRRCRGQCVGDDYVRCPVFMRVCLAGRWEVSFAVGLPKSKRVAPDLSCWG